MAIAKTFSRTAAAVLGVLPMAALLVGCGAPEPQAPQTTAAAPMDSLAGLNRIAGTVTAEEPFSAAQVYARNIDKNMLYTVFTHNGQYQAINLMHGGYEVWAEKGGLRSEHQWLRLQDGASVQLDLHLVPGPDFILTLKDSTKPGPQFGGVKEGARLVTYDEMYPSGPGRDLAEPTCLTCHGASFLPSHRMDRVGWHAMVGIMLDPSGAFADPNSARSITAEEHDLLADYLAENFGPDSEPRLLRLDVEYPLDEETLSSAMFIEYLTPLRPGEDLTQRSPNEPGKHRIHRPHIDNDGNLWGSNSLIGISRVDPRTAHWSHFPLGYDENNPETDMYGRKKGDPQSVWKYLFPHDLTIDSEGYVFWAEFQGQHLGRLDPRTGKVDRFHMDPEGVVVDEKGVVGNIRGHSPHMDADGNVWFTAIRGNKLGFWDRETEDIKLWEIPTPHSFPYGIEVDQQGEVWFAELYGCAVGRFNPTTEEFTEYPALTKPCAINRLAADSQGTIWYSVFSSGKLGKLDPKTGEQKEYDVLPFSKVKASAPYGIIADHDDNIWFGDGGLGGALIKFDVATETFTYYPEPRQADNPNLDITRDGAIIFSTRSNNQAALGMFYPDVSKMTGYGAYR
jgi:virginiamycin B lyase